jgi:uracil-DNA glycosylase
VDEGRGELAGIVRETRVLLERERARGRTRFVFGTAAIAALGDAAIAALGDAATSDLTGPGTSNLRDLSSPVGPQRLSEPHRGLRRLPPVDVPGPSSAEVMALPGFESVVPQQTQRATAIPISQPLAPSPDLPQDLSVLAKLVSTCRKCGLCETRTQTVFADGPPTARLLLVGEAPGRDEDAQGIPFVGRAGQLLNKMLAAIDLKREEVYICNVLKCRPPENRTPLPEEVERCLPYLEQQIAVIRPSLICALGLSAAQALLRTKASMTSMRGRVFEFRGVPLIPTYHPAALLRNPGLKREAWVDLQRVRDALRGEAHA